MKTCYFCSQTLSPKPLLRIPDSPFTDSFTASVLEAKNCFKADISIFQCPSCGVVQNPLPLCSQDYYQDYEYTSSRSPLVANFMRDLAEHCIKLYSDLNHSPPTLVLEPGSGDGFQLKCFQEHGLTVQGIEPSYSLTQAAIANGCDTICSLFDSTISSRLPHVQYDIVISSYTFDHSPDPLQFLETAYNCLRQDGLLCLEVHDVSLIQRRCEFSLFEHEHTVYLNAAQLEHILMASGFKLISHNPFPQAHTRANSLIVIAQKLLTKSPLNLPIIHSCSTDLRDIQAQLHNTVSRLDSWVTSRSSNSLVGYGAGGRGVMTLAQLSQATSFKALLDISYRNTQLYTPLSAIPVVGPERFQLYANSDVLVFSFGYFQEILAHLLSLGYKNERIFNYLDIA